MSNPFSVALVGTVPTVTLTLDSRTLMISSGYAMISAMSFRHFLHKACLTTCGVVSCTLVLAETAVDYANLWTFDVTATDAAAGDLHLVKMAEWGSYRLSFPVHAPNGPAYMQMIAEGERRLAADARLQAMRNPERLRPAPPLRTSGTPRRPSGRAPSTDDR